MPDHAHTRSAAVAWIVLGLLASASTLSAEERPEPTQELMARTYCAVPLDEGHVIAGTTFGLVLYRLPMPRPQDGGPQAVLVGPEPVVMLPDSVNDLWAAQGLVVAAIGPAGIRMVPLNDDGTRPVTGGIVELETSGAALSVAMDGNLLVAALGVMGVAVYDVSDPAHPVLRSLLETGGYARHVLLVRSGGGPGDDLWVYVANGRKGVVRLRLGADGVSVLETGMLESEGDVRRLHRFRDGLLFSRGHKGLCYADLSLAAESVTCVPSSDVIRGIASNGNTVVAADGGAGVMLVDWSDLRNPASPVHHPLGDGSANRVLVSGTYAIVAADFHGIRVLNLAELPVSTTPRPAEDPR